jgi:hypothetical protein
VAIALTGTPFTVAPFGVVQVVIPLCCWANAITLIASAARKVHATFRFIYEKVSFFVLVNQRTTPFRCFKRYTYTYL